MKSLLIALLLFLALPIAARAAEDVFNNERGSISISDLGIESKGSQLVYYLGIVPPEHHSLGSVRFSTGPFINGSLQDGGKFSPIGSSFEVIGRGNYGEPKGLIFSGQFVCAGPMDIGQQDRRHPDLQFRGNIQGIFTTAGWSPLHNSDDRPNGRTTRPGYRTHRDGRLVFTP